MDRGAWRAKSPWGHKESDATERLSTHPCTHTSLQQSGRQHSWRPSAESIHGNPPSCLDGASSRFPFRGPNLGLTAAADPGKHCSTITRQTEANSKPSPGQENLASSRVESKEINIRTNEVFKEEIMCGVGRRRGEVFYFRKKKEAKKLGNFR